MKRWTKFIIFFLLITNLIFIFTTVMYKNLKINDPVLKGYSFAGESGDIKISDGVIIISKDKQIVKGGEIQYLGSKRENIASYTKTIYFDNHQGNKEPIVVTSVSSNIENRMVFPEELLLNKNIGNISGEKLLIDDGKSTIKDNLYFSLEGFTNEGKSFNYEVKLQVNELI